MIKGSIVALITPFNRDLSVNYKKLRELIEFHIDNQTDGILVLGTSGEASTLSFDEKKKIVDLAVKMGKGQVHIMAHAGSNDTKTAIHQAQTFENLGVDSLLSITPYYNKTNDSGIIKHFEAIAASVHIPVVIYHVPGRTGYFLPVTAVKVLSKHPNIAGIKEASGDIAYATQISPYLSDDFYMFSGNDDIIVPMMSLGGVGVISVWANIFPGAVKELVNAYQGDPAKSLSLQKKYLNLIHSLFTEVNPIPVKYAMREMGMAVGAYRLPLDEAGEQTKEIIRQALKELENEDSTDR